jgi:hypothetical protein
VWNLDYQHAFEALKRALVDVLVLVRLDFKKPFCLDVDWSAKCVGVILSQKGRKLEKMMAYANSGTKEIPPHGRGMLCTNMGHYA